MIGELEGGHGAARARIALAVVGKLAALSGALCLLLATVVAHADPPSFVLAQSGAGPGNRVHFSISGTDSRATYTLEVDGEAVAEGSVPADSGTSGEFTMPDLGSTSTTVTVEVEIKQTDETTTRVRTLQYVAPSPASSAPAEPQPTLVPTPAPAAQSTQASVPAPRAQQRKRRASRPAARKRRAHSPRRTLERHVSKRRHSAGAGDRHGGRSRAWAPATRPSSSSGGPRSEGRERLSRLESQKRRPSGRHGTGTTLAPGMKRLLAVPTAPAIFSVASGVASYEDGGVPVGALTVLFLLGLTALTLAGGGLAPKRRPPHMKRRARAKNHPRRERVARHSPVAKPGYPATQATELIAANPVVIPLQEATASFAPIALDLVDARATLATRAERKYILDAMVFERLIGEIVPHYLILEIDDERVFAYESVYFDTPTRTTYRQHLQERRRRFKCRSRLYASSRLCYFEVKMKGGRGETIKRRLELDAEEHGLLTSPAFGFLERELQEAYGARPPTPLAPALSTFYRRLTLVGRENSERLTFDFELKFAGNDREYSIQPGRVLLETKSDVGAGNANRAAGGANRVLRRLGVRPVQSCSKYCLGVALTHPELRNNPFRPLIRHHFDAGWQDRAPRYYGEPAAPRSVELEPDGDPVAPPLSTWQEGTA